MFGDYEFTYSDESLQYFPVQVSILFIIRMIFNIDKYSVLEFMVLIYTFLMIL